MQIIKLSATDSTNTYLKDLTASERLMDFTVVVTNEQIKGRGQTTASWESEPGKNLTFSVLKRWEGISPKHQFLISICVSLAIYDALYALNVPELKVKWPNDILSGNSKICGILIENSIIGSQIKSTIVGIGLNVNQITFPKYLKTSSVKLLLGKEFDLNSLLTTLLEYIEKYMSKLEVADSENLYTAYEHVLFRKDIPSIFQKPDGHSFSGTIEGISIDGRLKVRLGNGELCKFNLREVKLNY